MAMHIETFKFIILLVLTVFALSISEAIQTSGNSLESYFIKPISLESAKRCLRHVNKELEIWANNELTALWDYQQNLDNKELKINRIRVSNASANFKKELWREILKDQSWKNLNDSDVINQFLKMSDIGISALPSNLLEEYENLMNQMVTKFSTAKVCQLENREKCDLDYHSNLKEIMATSQNISELEYYWIEWRKVLGPQIKVFYPTYVELANKGAKLNGFKDKSEVWLKQYEADNFEKQIETVLKEIKPLYEQIHAYVRRKLREKYGDTIVSKDGPIPAHLLGNMWSASWENIANFTIPFPGKKLPNITAAMIAQNYTLRNIFEQAEFSFVSMNMSAVPDTFWEKSVFKKIPGHQMVCKESAWDFYDSKDFRIRMCTKINGESFLTAHQEMGHIQYYLQYKDQPVVYRRGANPGFHEAIGDVMSLSVSTPKHLHKLELLENDIVDHEASINHLFLKGLEIVPFLPYAYIMDLYRWGIFRDQIKPDNYNCRWWNLSESFQGIEPPVNRTEKDFDAATTFHVAYDVEFLRYFVSNIISFQFYRSLCIEAGEFDPKNPNSKPLHECDFTDSKKAGNLMKAMLKMGSSKPWQDAMEVMTGQRNMSSSGLMDYFQPLMNWLQTENEKTNEFIGWKKSTKRCVKT